MRTVRPSTFDRSELVPLAQEQHQAEGTQMSLVKVFEPRIFRARFAYYWSDFLKQNYRNPEEVAASFGVRYQTALNWWQGANRTSGDVVAMAGKPLTDYLEGKI